MAIFTKKVAAYCLVGMLACNEGYKGASSAWEEFITPDEIQPDVWQIVAHPEYNFIKTVQHRHEGTIAKLSQAYVYPDGESYYWQSSAIFDNGFPEREPKSWFCLYDRGSHYLRNEFDGEEIPTNEVEIVQSYFSGHIVCTAEHERDGLIRAITDPPVSWSMRP